MRPRIALAAFLAIAALSLDLDPILTAIRGQPSPDEERARMVAEPWIGYDRFLDGVRHSTRPGDSIAIVVAPRTWSGGYEYAYRRAAYLLAGRAVLPVLDPDGAPLDATISRASHVAAWGESFRDPARTVLWRAEGGELLGPR